MIAIIWELNALLWVFGSNTFLAMLNLTTALIYISMERNRTIKFSALAGFAVVLGLLVLKSYLPFPSLK